MVCLHWILLFLLNCAWLGSCNDDVVWHIPTPQEGVVSHFLSLMRLRSLLKMHHRHNVTIKEALFRSTLHYPDLGDRFVNLCEIFKPPQHVLCTNATNLEIVANATCYADARTRFRFPEDYMLPNSSFIALPGHDFNYSSIECQVGYVYAHRGELQYPEFGFHQQYVSLWPHLKIAMNIELSSTYAVIHWRRGDQLTSRCARRSFYNKDTSVNCVESATDFILAAKHASSKYFPEVRQIFVATNEVNPSSLDALRKSGFTILSDVVRKVGHSLSSTRGVFNSLDEFVVELMIICESDYFLAWGVSTVQEIPKQFCTGPGRVRIINDKLS